jgi:hypothetical protein
MTFELEEAVCQLVHKNDRLEKHGEEDRLACDLNLTYETNNGCLVLFSPTLRSLVYEHENGAQTELVKDPDHLTKLRNPALHGGPLKWAAGELVGAEVRFHYGPTGKSDIVFDMAKVGKYKIECREGGTVVLHFQAQVYPNESQSGKLSLILTNKVCTVSIKPPLAN